MAGKLGGKRLRSSKRCYRSSLSRVWQGEIQPRIAGHEADQDERRVCDSHRLKEQVSRVQVRVKVHWLGWDGGGLEEGGQSQSTNARSDLCVYINSQAKGIPA